MKKLWLLLVAILLSFSLTASAGDESGSIKLTIFEPDAEIFVDGKKVEDAVSDGEENIVEISPGKYEIEIKKSGFYTWSRIVNVVKDYNPWMVVNLRRIEIERTKVELYVSEGDAKVYIDGEQAGISPSDPSESLVLDTYEGLHRFTIEKRGFKTWEKTIPIPRVIVRMIIIGLEKLPSSEMVEIGKMRIKISHAGAVLYINDKFMGKRPISNDTEVIELECNRIYRVRIEKDGFKRWRKVLPVVCGKILKVDVELRMEIDPRTICEEYVGKAFGDESHGAELDMCIASCENSDEYCICVAREGKKESLSECPR